MIFHSPIFFISYEQSFRQNIPDHHPRHYHRPPPGRRRHRHQRNEKTTSNYHQSHPYQQQIQNKKVIEIKVTKRQTINEKEHLPCDLFELYSYTCLAVFTWFLNNWLFRISFADVFGAALDSTCNRKKTNIFKSNYKENGVSNNNTNV